MVNFPLDARLQIVLAREVISGLIIYMLDVGNERIDVPCGNLLMRDGIDDSVAYSGIEVNRKAAGYLYVCVIGPKLKEKLVDDVFGFFPVFHAVVGKYIKEAMVPIINLRLRHLLPVLPQRY